MMQVIARETEEADKVKVVVSQEEEAASKEAAGVKAIKVNATHPHPFMMLTNDNHAVNQH